MYTDETETIPFNTPNCSVIASWTFQQRCVRVTERQFCHGVLLGLSAKSACVEPSVLERALTSLQESVTNEGFGGEFQKDVVSTNVIRLVHVFEGEDTNFVSEEAAVRAALQYSQCDEAASLPPFMCVLYASIALSVV